MQNTEYPTSAEIVETKKAMRTAVLYAFAKAGTSTLSSKEISRRMLKDAKGRYIGFEAADFKKDRAMFNRFLYKDMCGGGFLIHGDGQYTLSWMTERDLRSPVALEQELREFSQSLAKKKETTAPITQEQEPGLPDAAEFKARPVRSIKHNVLTVEQHAAEVVSRIMQNGTTGEVSLKFLLQSVLLQCHAHRHLAFVCLEHLADSRAVTGALHVQTERERPQLQIQRPEEAEEEAGEGGGPVG